MSRFIPTEIKAGLTLGITVELAYFAAPDWALVLLLRGPSSITIDSADLGDAHVLSASAAVTAAWEGGQYAYSLRATNGGDISEIEAGTVVIVGDLAAIPAGSDTRTHARKVLAAIEAVIEKRATLDQERYRINDRELYRTPLADLLRLRASYRSELARENSKANGGNSLLGREVRVRT